MSRGWGSLFLFSFLSILLICFVMLAQGGISNVNIFVGFTWCKGGGSWVGGNGYRCDKDLTIC